MLEAIILTLKIMGWLGVILAILSSTNILTKTLTNIWSKKESFSWNKMLKGIGKVLVFYFSAVAVSIAFTILPFINEMIITFFGVMLISNDTLNTLSSTGILGIVMATVVTQGTKAIQSILELSKISTGEREEITWKVEEE